MRLILRSDNETGVAAIRKGYSRKLAYLKKHQRISLGALHEVYAENGPNVLADEAGIDMIADPMTKPLDVAAHWRHFRRMGLVALPP